MTPKTLSTYRVEIFIAGDLDEARKICRIYCMAVGLCVTITPTEFIYVGGAENGVCVGLVNYPRFPSTPEEIWRKAKYLAERLRLDLCQWTYLLVAPDKTEWVNEKPDPETAIA